MEQTLRYFKRCILQGNPTLANQLRRSTHPDLIDFCFDLLSNPDYKTKIKGLALHCFRHSDDPRCHEYLVTYYCNNLRYNTYTPDMYKLDDDRLLPPLIEFFDNLSADNYRTYQSVYQSRLKALITWMGEASFDYVEDHIERFKNLALRIFGKNHPLPIITSLLRDHNTPAAQALADESESYYHRQLEQLINSEIQKINPSIAQTDTLHFHLLTLMKHTESGGENLALKFISHDNFYVRKAMLLYLCYQIQRSWSSVDKPDVLLDAVLHACHQPENERLRPAILKQLSSIPDARISAMMMPYFEQHLNSQESDCGLQEIVESFTVNLIDVLDTDIICLDIPYNLSTGSKTFEKYLYAIGTQQAIDILANIIDGSDAGENNRDALESLGKLSRNSDSALNHLSRYLESPDEELRRQTITALGNSNERAIPLLVNFHPANDLELFDVISTMGNLKSPECILYLAKHLMTITIPEGRLYNTVVAALERIGTESAFHILNDWMDVYKPDIIEKS